MQLKHLWWGSSVPEKVIESFLSFRRQLSHNRSPDGRIVLSLVGDSTHSEELEIKYQLLNPSTTFREVVDSARSVILAGGTMSPVIVVRCYVCPVS